MSYQGIFDFINIYSETFVFYGDEEVPVSSAASKPWLSQKLPKLNSQSGNDICFKKDGALCVIYLASEQPGAEVEEMIDRATHSIVIGRVVEIVETPDKGALTHWNGAFRALN